MESEVLQKIKVRILLLENGSSILNQKTLEELKRIMNEYSNLETRKNILFNLVNDIDKIIDDDKEFVHMLNETNKKIIKKIDHIDSKLMILHQKSLNL